MSLYLVHRRSILAALKQRTDDGKDDEALERKEDN